MFLQRATKRIVSFGKTVTRNVALAGENKRFLREKFKSLGEGDVLFEKLEYQGHNIAVISLANPKNRNALSGKMMVKLAEIVDGLQHWSEGNAVILRGVEKTFCSGADLAVARSILSHEEGEMMSTLMHDTILRLKYLPFISVAVAEGQSLGGGAELLLCCDFRLATSNAVIQFVQARMGVIPGWGGAAQLVDLVGKREALKILVSSKKIHPTQALDMGLVDEIIPQDTEDVQSAVCDWLLPYLKPPPAVIHAMKKCIMGNIKPLEETLEFERSIFKTMWSGEHNLKALEKNLKHSKS